MSEFEGSKIYYFKNIGNNRKYPLAQNVTEA